MSVKITIDRTDAVMKSIRALADQKVLVGIPSTDPARQPEPGEPAEINNATLAYINEFGSPAQNIPARPFLVPGVDAARVKVVGRLKTAASAALDGNSAGVDRGLNAAGLEAQNSVRAKIQSGPFAPLSERTLEERRRRGRTGTKPLIDTGQLRNAITYVIRKLGG